MSWAVKIRLLMVFLIGAISFIAAIQWQLAQKTLPIDTLCELNPLTCDNKYLVLISTQGISATRLAGR